MNIFTLPQTEEAAINFLQSKSILPNEKFCANGHEMQLSVGKQVRWRFENRHVALKAKCGLEIG